MAENNAMAGLEGIKNIDPDVRPLREALGGLQQMVTDGALTPKQANAAMGKVADSLEGARRRAGRVTRTGRLSSSAPNLQNLPIRREPRPTPSKAEIRAIPARRPC